MASLIALRKRLPQASHDDRTLGVRGAHPADGRPTARRMC
jgi:hypothetical protein